jgi:hypothetical protein
LDMITIVELPEYIKKSEKLLDSNEREKIIRHLSLNPLDGVLLKGTEGIRKIRWGRPGIGKRGGVRIIYFFYNEEMPVFLLTMFGKNEKENLTKSESNELAKLSSLLVNSYKRGEK